MTTLSTSAQLRAWANSIAAQAVATDLPPAQIAPLTAALDTAVAALANTVQVSGQVATFANGPEARDLTPQGRTAKILAMVNGADDAASAALQQVASAANTLRDALASRFQLATPKPASLSDTMYALRYQTLTNVLDVQGGQDPSRLLNALQRRLAAACEEDDAAAVYILSEGLDDWALAHEIGRADYDAVVALVLAQHGAAPSASDDTTDSSARLYAMLTTGGEGTLKGFLQLAQVVVFDEIAAARSRLNVAAY